MNPEREPITPAELDAYLDGQLDSAAREAFEERLSEHPDLQAEVLLQAKVDESLARLFPAGELTDGQFAAMLANAEQSANAGGEVSVASSHTRENRRAWLAGTAAVAASLALMAILWQQRRDEKDVVFFQPRPLVEVYQEVVASGFEPYYECREEDRFRSTFLRRQGKELRLNEFPAGMAMMGLSYPGGLSRNTTAMLCRVDGEPVMVFVDRESNDTAIDWQNDQSELHLFRESRHGLVFYEVTPFDSARVTRHLVAAD